MTATATTDTIKFIKDLCMSSVVQFIQVPEKSNLKYFVYKVDDSVEVFDSMIEELKFKKYEYNRFILLTHGRLKKNLQSIFQSARGHIC